MHILVCSCQPEDPGCPAGWWIKVAIRTPGREPTVEALRALLRNTSRTTEYAVPLLVKEGPLLVEGWQGRDGLICSCQSN